MTFEAHAAFTPVGNPVGDPIPVAPVVEWVILTIRVLIQRVGVDDAPPAVIFGVTVMVPVALAAPQPPVNGML
jgi:hypothetical protein